MTIKETAERKMIQVTQSTYSILNEGKRKKSFDLHLRQLQIFCDINGIDPEKYQQHPYFESRKDAQKTLDRIDDVIKILRNIEKTDIKPAHEKLEILLLNRSSSLDENIPDDDNYVGKSMTTQELSLLISANEKLKIKYEEEKKRNTLLQAKTENIKTSIASDSQKISNFDIEVILQCLEALEEKASPLRFKPENIEMAKDDFHSLISRIKKELGK